MQTRRNKQKDDYKLRVRGELKRRLIQFLRQHPCVDCGEDDYVVLELDHVRGKKIKSVARLINDCVKWNVIQRELRKCEVRCANCHRRKTALDLQYWKQLDYSDVV